MIETGFGDAASESIVKRSATGPYGQLVKGVALSIQKRTAMAPAATRRRSPRWSRRGECLKSTPRYAVGKYAKLLIRMRVWLGDRLFDRIILSQMR